MERKKTEKRPFKGHEGLVTFEIAWWAISFSVPSSCHQSGKQRGRCHLHTRKESSPHTAACSVCYLALPVSAKVFSSFSVSSAWQKNG